MRLGRTGQIKNSLTKNRRVNVDISGFLKKLQNKFQKEVKELK